ncbi:hypothetical protein A0H81_13771 [Grifola frondosa]|uniref:G domain-containing protein n=1 Tax=Grifola frondosa TaxID=5627 RepID=A0A1C7LN40_GRIFR|nr:hypothetical protein A0H81_13771 [Grifola frondosa]
MMECALSEVLHLHVSIRWPKEDGHRLSLLLPSGSNCSPSLISAVTHFTAAANIDAHRFDNATFSAVQSSVMKPRRRLVTIAVMGPTGAGKSTFINVASGSNLRVGTGLQSCTDRVESSSPFDLDDCIVTLVDTPGFDDTTKSDAEVLNMVAGFLKYQYEQGQLLNGIIYMHRISDYRAGGSAVRNFRFFKQLCGDDFLPNSAIVTNMWGDVTEELGERREQELFGKDVFFKSAIDKDANKSRHHNTLESAHEILRPLAGKPPQALLIQKELVDEKKRLCETAAGIALLGELAENERKHQERLDGLQRELKEAMEARDRESVQELEEALRSLAAEEQRLQARRMAIQRAEERAWEIDSDRYILLRIRKLMAAAKEFARRYFLPRPNVPLVHMHPGGISAHSMTTDTIHGRGEVEEPFIADFA